MLKRLTVLWEVSEKTIVTKGGGSYVGTAKNPEQAKLMALAPLMWNLLVELGDKEALQKVVEAEKALE